MKQLTTSEAFSPDAADYEHDFVLWIERQAQLLREKKFDQLDVQNVIEEFDSMGRSERHELRSRIETLLVHLLKCQFQPDRKSGSWLGALAEQRSQISQKLEDSPSLGTLVSAYAGKRYQTAVGRAADETGLSRSTFPPTNPYSREQLLDAGFVP